MNMNDAIAARGLDPGAALKREIARVKAASKNRQYVLVIPGVNDAARRNIRDSFGRAHQALAEQREILLCPPGTERVREYIRAFDRINGLVHLTVDFPSQPEPV